MDKVKCCKSMNYDLVDSWITIKLYSSKSMDYILNSSPTIEESIVYKYTLVRLSYEL